MAIHQSRLRKKEAVFTWVETDSTLVLHVATDRLAKYLAAARSVKAVEITDQLLHVARWKNGVEPQQLAALAAAPLSMVPAILLDMGDGTHVLADGNHRVLDWHRRGMVRFPAWVAEPKVWRRFLVDMPGDRETWLKFTKTFNSHDWRAGKPWSPS